MRHVRQSEGIHSLLYLRSNISRQPAVIQSILDLVHFPALSKLFSNIFGLINWFLAIYVDRCLFEIGLCRNV